MRFRPIAFTIILTVLLHVSSAWAQDYPRPVLQNGHRDSINVAGFSADGRLVITASRRDGTVKVWDRTSKRLLATVDLTKALPGSSDPTVMAISRDGRTLAVGGTVVLIDTVSGRILRTLDRNSYALPRAFSDDGTMLATTDNAGRDLNAPRAVRIWDTRSGECRLVLRDAFKLETGEFCGHVAFSRDGRLIATGGGDDVRLWERPTGRPVSTLKNARSPLAFSPDSRTLATASTTESAQIWDVATGKCAATLPGIPKSKKRRDRDRVSGVAFSPDGKQLVTGYEAGGMRLWSVPDRKALAEDASTTSGGALGTTVAFSPDGRSFLMTIRLHRSVQLRSARTGAPILTLEGRGGDINSVAVSPDGRMLAAGSADTSANVWDLTNGSHRAALVTPPNGAPYRDAVEKVAFLSDGETLVSGPIGRALVWDTSTGKLRTSVPNNNAAVSGEFAVSANGRLMAVNEGRTVVEMPGGKVRWTFKSGGRFQAFSPDGRWLAAGPNVWDVTSGRLVTTLPFQENPIFSTLVAFGPGGAIATTRDDVTGTKVTLWDAASGRAIRDIPLRARVVNSLAVSPDGRTVAVGGYGTDFPIELYDAASGRLGRVLSGHEREVRSIAFSANNKVVFSGSRDTSIRVWSAESGTLLATLFEVNAGREWLAVTPEGFFDGSTGGMQSLLWRLGPNLYDLAEPEQFLADFYHPGLLSDLVSEAKPIRQILQDRGDPRASAVITQKDRRLPRVALNAPAASKARTVQVTVQIGDSPAGARDVRLFRNGVLVHKWSGAQKAGALSATVPVVAGKNVLTAYAFNRDNVKSKDAVAQVQGDASLRRAPHGWIVAIGVNQYADPRFNLRFASADATAMAGALKQRLPLPSGAVQALTLLDARATREAIVAALRDVGRKAQPEDTVVVSFSGHGLLLNGHFYMVPHDLGNATDPDDVAKHCISDTQLESIFTDYQAERICLVLDACHSGQALESPEWRRGPMNARGLVQLAWEKGMEVLAASQSQQAALETWKIGGKKIGHGLLTFALVEEGLSRAPRHGGQLRAADWLDYAAARVPTYFAGGAMRGRDLVLKSLDTKHVQVPRVFHRREGGGAWPVAGH